MFSLEDDNSAVIYPIVTSSVYDTTNNMVLPVYETLDFGLNSTFALFVEKRLQDIFLDYDLNVEMSVKHNFEDLIEQEGAWVLTMKTQCKQSGFFVR